MRKPQDMDFYGLEAELAPLREALKRLHGGERAPLLAQLAWYLRERDTREALSLADEGLALLGAGARGEPTERERYRARLLLARAHGTWRFALTDEAVKCARLAFEGFQRVGDAVGKGDTCTLTASIQSSCGQLTQSVESLSDAVKYYADAGDALRGRFTELMRIRELANRDVDSGRRAWVLLQQTIDVQDHPAFACYANLIEATLEFNMGRFGEAIRRFMGVFPEASACGLVREGMRASSGMALSYASLSVYEQALEWAEKTLASARSTGWPEPTALALDAVGAMLMNTKRLDAAREVLLEARSLQAPFKGSRGWSIGCRYLGDTLTQMHLCDQALHWLDEAEQSARLNGAKSEVVLSLASKGRVLALMGNRGEAIGAAREALALARQWEYRDEECYAASAMATILLAPAGAETDQVEAARAALAFQERALDLQTQLRGELVHVDLLEELSRTHEILGHIAEALAFSRRAMEVSTKTYNQRSAAAADAMRVRLETERARAEAEHQKSLAEAEARRADAEAAANRAKSTFLANMSHELRSPLNAMLGFSRLLLRSPRLAEQDRRDLAIVLGSGEHLYALINQVLELSKIEAGGMSLQRGTCDVHALLETLHAMFALAARDKGLALSFSAGPEVPRYVEVDVGKVRQVLVNLLSNAIKFTPRGGVTLLAELPGEDRLEFTVTDTGVGIAADELSSLGEAFVQAKAGTQAAEGTGLGLAISRAFVRLMGGELDIRSQPDRGTSVSFAVEVAMPAQPAAAAPAQARAIRIAGDVHPRVLLVDDRPEGRELLARLLRPLGFEVREAANGQEAIYEWQRWAPQAICMDMRMPVLDGREATRRIKATPEGQHTIIIAVTASSFDEQREEVLALGCDDFVRKPFQEEVLLQILAKHLHLSYEREALPGVEAGMDDAALAEHLAALPQALRARLRDSLQRLDVTAIEQGLNELRALDPAAAAVVALMVEQFRFERVAALLAEA